MRRRAKRGALVAGGAGIILGLMLATGGPARAQGATPDAPFIDRREIVVPARPDR